ncbi:hypothetical protein LSH36_276g02022 [Paralvinella palmiformis]|uniref:Uncharacterized protein n=1 Tax=Paralvinella palmiformis TaxID=53620 RepID=A0AAD9JKW3_9ANNE|nr:hypothetical protein LSH36_276g02022 [Paralvinella palmiformis]
MTSANKKLRISGDVLGRHANVESSREKDDTFKRVICPNQFLAHAVQSHLSNTNQNSSGSRQRTNSVISGRHDRSLIPGFRTRVLTDLQRYSLSTNRRLFPNRTSYSFWSTLRRHQHFPVICAGVVVLPVGDDIAIAVRAVSRCTYLKSSQEIQGRHVAAINCHGFLFHPAFQFQAHRFYPNSLLSSIRQPANGIPKQQPVRNIHGAVEFRVDVVQHRRHHGSFQTSNPDSL